ncbi:MAG TPA: ABC transporter ATP-binding protein [Candidatus Dormibacteraeota bacterium]|nr:ABC transporter ATP-binding protein [Candidatus Dormibacteraeota bacterium]
MTDPVASPPAAAPTTAQQPALETRGVRRSLPLGDQRIEILRGIDLAILPGESVALMGPSGSGKSTLLGVLAGLDRPTDGRVLVDGIDITDMPESQLAVVRNAKIGMVFQAFNLIPTLTAQENVEVPLYVGTHTGSAATRAREMLNLVGLSHRTGHKPNQLSGGEQQRVAIARALATDPAIVIADEPTGNLDAHTGEVILELLADLRQRLHTTFLIATHDPRVAGRAERTITIVDGLLQAD